MSKLKTNLIVWSLSDSLSNANFSTLSEALDKTRKKYQSRIKHMEQQVLQSIIKGPNDMEITAQPLLSFPADLESEKSDSD